MENKEKLSKIIAPYYSKPINEDSDAEAFAK